MLVYIANTADLGVADSDRKRRGKTGGWEEEEEEEEEEGEVNEG